MFGLRAHGQKLQAARTALRRRNKSKRWTVREASPCVGDLQKRGEQKVSYEKPNIEANNGTTEICRNVGLYEGG